MDILEIQKLIKPEWDSNPPDLAALGSACRDLLANPAFQYLRHCQAKMFIEQLEVLRLNPTPTAVPDAYFKGITKGIDYCLDTVNEVIAEAEQKVAEANPNRGAEPR